jgi:NADP-dependent 3-hydroxy acid dehydrogenase YdfG
VTSAFSGQVAVVTGATGAIGKAISARLLAGGATVCLVGTTEESLADLQRSTGWAAGQVFCYPVDLSVDASARQFCANCRARHPLIHILVHSAGAIVLETVERGRVEDFDRQYQINVRAPYQLTQALLPQITACQGQVAFINSSAGLHARRGAAQYAATKHALRAVADSLREEVNDRGVRVLSVFLGRTASRMQAAVHRQEGRPYNAGTLLQPDDVASVVVHALALPRTAEVTDVSIRPLQKSY